MKTFIQLRNNIGFAVLHTQGEPDHSVTPDHTTAVDVTGHRDPESLLKQIYDHETKTWTPAPVFKIADIGKLGDIVEIRRTVFTHEIDEDSVVMPEGVDFRYKYIDGEWVAPVFYENVVPSTEPTPVEAIQPQQ